jgi:hypothetical protein
MSDPQPFPVWIFLLFPVAFAAVWLLVTGLLGTLGGWSALARLYPDHGDAPAGDVVEIPGTSLGLQRAGMPFPVRYKRCVTVLLSATGVHLRVMALFRFRHPPLLIPWAQVERMETGHLARWRGPVIHPRGTGTTILVHGGAAGAIEEAWALRAGTPAQSASAPS